MTNQVDSEELTASPLQSGVMCAVALLYQKNDGTKYINKVRVCFVEYDEKDDEYGIKAKGERYFATHPDFKDELEEFAVVAWQCVTGENT